MTTDLHSKIIAAVNDRLQWALDLGAAEWTAEGDLIVAPGSRARGRRIIVAETNRAGFAEWAAANDPATVIRHCEADLRRLERHRRDGYDCATCMTASGNRYEHPSPAYWPCAELRILAAAYGVSVDD